MHKFLLIACLSVSTLFAAEDEIARGGGGGGHGGGGYGGGHGGYNHGEGNWHGDARAYDRGYDRGLENGAVWGGAVEGGGIYVEPAPEPYYYENGQPYPQ